MAETCYILGAEVMTALGPSLSETWQGLLEGRCGIAMPRRLAGRVREDCVIAEMHPAAFEKGGGGGMPVEVALAARAARPVLTACGLPRGNMALVLATTKVGLAEVERRAGGQPASLAAPITPWQCADAVAAALELGGPVYTVSTACASGLTALELAARLIASGFPGGVLAVGIDLLTPFIVEGFHALGALSAIPCRPFDAHRDGLSLGEGVGVMLLHRRSAGAGMPGRLAGVASTSDATHLTAPDREGRHLARAVGQALRRARLDSADVDFINAHGTGTLHNDEAEAEAIHRAFGEAVPPVASFKGSIGHTLGAAGIIEAALCMKVLETGRVPPCTGCTKPGTTRPLPLCLAPAAPARLRHLVTVKAGFGGLNAAAVLDRAEGACA